MKALSYTLIALLFAAGLVRAEENSISQWEVAGFLLPGGKYKYDPRHPERGCPLPPRDGPVIKPEVPTKAECDRLYGSQGSAFDLATGTVGLVTEVNDRLPRAVQVLPRVSKLLGTASTVAELVFNKFEWDDQVYHVKIGEEAARIAAYQKCLQEVRDFEQRVKTSDSIGSKAEHHIMTVYSPQVPSTLDAQANPFAASASGAVGSVAGSGSVLGSPAGQAASPASLPSTVGPERPPTQAIPSHRASEGIRNEVGSSGSSPAEGPSPPSSSEKPGGGSGPCRTANQKTLEVSNNCPKQPPFASRSS